MELQERGTLQDQDWDSLETLLSHVSSFEELADRITNSLSRRTDTAEGTNEYDVGSIPSSLQSGAREWSISPQYVLLSFHVALTQTWAVFRRRFSPYTKECLTCFTSEISWNVICRHSTVKLHTASHRIGSSCDVPRCTVFVTSYLSTAELPRAHRTRKARFQQADVGYLEIHFIVGECKYLQFPLPGSPLHNRHRPGLTDDS